MAKKNKKSSTQVIEPKDVEVIELDEVDEDSESEETTAPQGIRPNDLAQSLGVDGKRVRAFLRQTFPRPADAKNSSWFLTDAQAQAVRDRFTKSDDDESTEEDEA